MSISVGLDHMEYRCVTIPDTAMTFAHLHCRSPPPPTMPGPDPGPGPGVSTSTAFVVYQYCLCCLPVLPLLSTSTAFLSTSTASVVYQYCLCCLPVLPCCLPLGPGMLLYYAVTVNPLKTLCILTQQPALRCASLSTDSCCFASKTEFLRLHIS